MNLCIRIAFAGACASAAPQAQAALFCVDTGIELETAIETAAKNGADDEIRIAAGSITGSSEPLSYPRWSYAPAASDEATRVEISGGWTPASTCTQQSQQPDVTQVDAEYKGPAFDFSSTADGYAGEVSLRNLLVTRGRSSTSEAAAVGYSAAGAGARFTLERTVIVASKADSPALNIVSLVQNGGGQVRLRNNAVADNSVNRAGGSTVFVHCDAISLCYVNNNSIYDNFVVTNGSHYGLTINGLVNASNNVVADNIVGDDGFTGYQAGSTSGQHLVTLRNNHFQSKSFPAAYSETGTTVGDPKWTHAFIYAYPNADSPLLNSGINNPFGGVSALDIDGDPRIQQGVIDRGAIEIPPTANAAPTLLAPAQAVLPETTAQGATVFTVAANDDGKPAPLTLSISNTSCAPGGTTPFLGVDAAGTVRLIADIPDATSCNVTVTAYDGQAGASATVLVRINRAPSLQDEFLSIASDLAVGSPVWQVEGFDDTNPPGGTLNYQLTMVQATPSAPNPFALGAQGALTLAQALPAISTQYTLTVKVCDAGDLCGTGTLQVDSIGATPAPGDGPIFADGFE